MPSRITQANWCNVFPNCCFLMLEQCASFPRFETEERVLTSLLTCLQARWRLDGLHARIPKTRNIKPSESENRTKHWPNKRQHAPLDLSPIQGVRFTCHTCAVGTTCYPQHLGAQALMAQRKSWSHCQDEARHLPFRFYKDSIWFNGIQCHCSMHCAGEASLKNKKNMQYKIIQAVHSSTISQEPGSGSQRAQLYVVLWSVSTSGMRHIFQVINQPWWTRCEKLQPCCIKLQVQTHSEHS